MANASKNLAWAADVYARDYIPQALLAVNDSPAAAVPPSLSLEIDFSAYISAYAGFNFLNKLPQFETHQLSGLGNHQSNVGLSTEIYGQFFGDCMLLEMESQSE